MLMNSSNEQEPVDQRQECKTQQFVATNGAYSDGESLGNLVSNGETLSTNDMERSFMIIEKGSGSLLGGHSTDERKLSSSFVSKSDIKEFRQKVSDFNGNYNNTGALNNSKVLRDKYSGNTSPHLLSKRTHDSSDDGFPVVAFGSQQEIVDLYQGTLAKSSAILKSSGCFGSQTMIFRARYFQFNMSKYLSLKFYPDEKSNCPAFWNDNNSAFFEQLVLSEDEINPSSQRTVKVTDIDALFVEEEVNLVEDEIADKKEVERERKEEKRKKKDRKGKIRSKEEGEMVITPRRTKRTSNVNRLSFHVDGTIFFDVEDLIIPEESTKQKTNVGKLFMEDCANEVEIVPIVLVKKHEFFRDCVHECVTVEQVQDVKCDTWNILESCDGQTDNVAFALEDDDKNVSCGNEDLDAVGDVVNGGVVDSRVGGVGNGGVVDSRVGGVGNGGVVDSGVGGVGDVDGGRVGGGSDGSNGSGLGDVGNDSVVEGTYAVDVQYDICDVGFGFDSNGGGGSILSSFVDCVNVQKAIQDYICGVDFDVGGGECGDIVVDTDDIGKALKVPEYICDEDVAAGECGDTFVDADNGNALKVADFICDVDVDGGGGGQEGDGGCGFGEDVSSGGDVSGGDGGGDGGGSGEGSDTIVIVQVGDDDFVCVDRKDKYDAVCDDRHTVDEDIVYSQSVDHDEVSCTVVTDDQVDDDFVATVDADEDKRVENTLQNDEDLCGEFGGSGDHDKGNSGVCHEEGVAHGDVNDDTSNNDVTVHKLNNDDKGIIIVLDSADLLSAPNIHDDDDNEHVVYLDVGNCDDNNMVKSHEQMANPQTPEYLDAHTMLKSTEIWPEKDSRSDQFLEIQSSGNKDSKKKKLSRKRLSKEARSSKSPKSTEESLGHRSTSSRSSKNPKSTEESLGHRSTSSRSSKSPKSTEESHSTRSSKNPKSSLDTELQKPEVNRGVTRTSLDSFTELQKPDVNRGVTSLDSFT
ncbi:hypothetical protein QZH41_005051 [Actinostola sp. cb2023]|nr:hypothetical protein QZH41_005051 [Actinostola sp. cb2023]